MPDLKHITSAMRGRNDHPVLFLQTESGDLFIAFTGGREAGHVARVDIEPRPDGLYPLTYVPKG